MTIPSIKLGKNIKRIREQKKMSRGDICRKLDFDRAQVGTAEAGKGNTTLAMIEKIGTGVVHRVPKDMREVLASNGDVLERWNDLTALARNEWICWVTIVRTSMTREKHLKRLCEDLRGGKRRPCCWPGCPHRRPSARKWFGGIPVSSMLFREGEE